MAAKQSVLHRAAIAMGKSRTAIVSAVWNDVPAGAIDEALVNHQNGCVLLGHAEESRDRSDRDEERLNAKIALDYFEDAMDDLRSGAR